MASQVEGIKWIPGTSFLVDGFQFISSKCTAYFLTHFHSDHTIGLNKGFCQGPIYCTHTTAKLLTHDMGLNAAVVRPMELDMTEHIQGVAVTPITANHCPGACMFLFQVPSGEQQHAAAGGRASSKGSVRSAAGSTHNILHTGDCRWQDWIRGKSILAQVQVHTLYLDTTYALPKHTFPAQQDAIALMVQAMQQELRQQPHTLFLISAYHIGKERAIFGAAHALQLRVWCTPAKRRVLHLLDLPAEDLALLAEDADSAQVQISNWGMQPEALQRYLQPGSRWQQVVGFRPTGWSHRKAPGLQCWREGATAVYGVPYSEHSSWTDLRACVAALRPRKIVPTVNATTPARSRAIVDRFADLMDLSRDRSRLDCWLKGMQQQPRQQEQQQGSGEQRESQQQQQDQEEEEEAPEEERSFHKLCAGAQQLQPSAAVCSSAAAAREPEQLPLPTPAAAASDLPAASSADGYDPDAAPTAAAAAGGSPPAMSQADVAEQRRIWDVIQRDKARLERAAGLAAAKGSRRGAARQQHKRQKQVQQAGTDPGKAAAAAPAAAAPAGAAGRRQSVSIGSAASAATGFATTAAEGVPGSSTPAAGTKGPLAGSKRLASQASISSFFGTPKQRCL